jgi:hypothetical protein
MEISLYRKQAHEEAAHLPTETGLVHFEVPPMPLYEMPLSESPALVNPTMPFSCML